MLNTDIQKTWHIREYIYVVVVGKGDDMRFLRRSDVRSWNPASLAGREQSSV